MPTPEIQLGVQLQAPLWMQLAESGARRKKRDFQQRLLLLARSFQAGMTLLPGGYLAMPGDIFGCHNWPDKCHHIHRVDAIMLLNILQGTGEAPRP